MHVCSSLTRLFNMSMQQIKLPSLWKKQMSRHFKKKLMHQSLTIIGLYPYVAISYVGKAVFKYTFNHIRVNNLIYSNNYGFMSGHTTAHQLIHLYHVFCEALDNNEKKCIQFFY